MKEISEESSLVTMPSVFDCYWFDGSNLSKAASRQSFGRTGHRRRIRGRHCQGNGLYPHVRGYQGTHMARSEEHTSELQSLMRSSYAVFCLSKKNTTHHCIPCTLLDFRNTQTRPHSASKPATNT